MEETTPHKKRKKKSKKEHKKEKKEKKKHRREISAHQDITSTSASTGSAKKKSRKSTAEEEESALVVAPDRGTAAAAVAAVKGEGGAEGNVGAGKNVTSKEKAYASSASAGSKASAAVTTRVTVRVKEARPSEDPIVVSFPGGVPSSVLAAESNATADAEGGRTVSFHSSGADSGGGNGAGNVHHDLPLFSWSKLGRGSSNRGTSITGSDATCTYSASNEGRGHDGRLTKFYVGIYDREAKTLTLQPSAEKGTVFSLSQTVKEYRPSANGPVDATMKNMSASERRRLLFESFGSAKKQRALRSQAANVVNIDSVIGAGDAMMEAVGRQDMGESNRKAMEDVAASGRTKVDAVEVALAEARRNFLPSFDENANAPHKVYDAADIAGDDVWGYVSRVTDACTKKEEGGWREHLTNRGYWHGSICLLLKSIHIGRKGASDQIKTAVLLNSVMKFHGKCSKKNFFSGSAEELSDRFNVSKDVAPRLLELFAIPTDDRGEAGYAITKQLKDKRLVYMLILYLVANGREMKVGSINDFCRDIHLELNDAAKLLREAGCEAKKSGSTGLMSVSLKVPLKFPPPRRGKSR